ncbi:MAG: FAD-dependent oxidoreductase [Myxococcales bacterium]|nr:FAD-dependent oxidoreductase [Myxococcales bacterium]
MHELTLQLPVSPDAAPVDDDAVVIAAAADALDVPTDAIETVVLHRRSLDARKRRAGRWVLRCRAYLVGEPGPEGPDLRAIRPKRAAKPRGALRPIIVGMGPAGLFAALQFADYGVQCTILERGPPVERRNYDVRDLRTKGQLQPESNLCFGEGGAGTYSDGKLYSRSKSPRVREVYERLVALGLTERILTDAHPHVGTNRLIPMAKVLRQALVEAGHTLRFDARVTDLLVKTDGAQPQVIGVELADGEQLVGEPVLLATGHSARGVYAMLARHGVAMERKSFAIGARVEHPQALIDEVQLGDMAGWKSVGAAEYFLKQKVPEAGGSRGVYSFCMCPGGFVLPTPTALDHLNVNGMSNSGRNSKFANAALVAQIGADEMYLESPGDLDDDPDFGAHVAGGALLGLALQGKLERRAFALGGGAYHAPAQRLADFVHGDNTGMLPQRSSYRPGLRAADCREVLPSRIVAALVRGASQVDRGQLRGYLTNDAVIIPVETTTSSPVRIIRGPDRESISHRGLYPVAEGAGYAGGIVSSAIDGMNAAESLLIRHGLLAEEGR